MKKKITNFEKLNSELGNNTLIPDSYNTVDDMYNNFIQNFKSKIDSCSKLFINKSKLKFPKPWINSELERCLIAKNFWFNKYKKDKYNNILKDEYCYWRNKYTNLKTKLKKKHFSDKFIKKALTL